MNVLGITEQGRQPVSLSELPAVQATNLPALADQVMAFTQALSTALMQRPACREFDELVALGFWLRKASLTRFTESLNGTFKPLGLVVHYTPANVDTMFVYSWVCALLMGNRNIVRLSSQQSALQQTLLHTLLDVLNAAEFSDIANANQFIQYDHKSESGDELSVLADARVLWGGDDSVLQIRELPCKPRCRDISFADRHSACVINGEAFSGATTEQQVRLAELIWRDMQPYLQQACSSPRALVWVGDNRAKEALLEAIGRCAHSANAPETLRNEQLVFSQWLVASGEATAYQFNGRVCSIELSSGNALVSPAHPGNWILPVHSISSLNDLAALTTPKLQTLSYWGFAKDDMVKFLAQPSITGIDRVVPVGEALQFSPDWDGYELLTQLARKVVVL